MIYIPPQLIFLGGGRKENIPSHFQRAWRNWIGLIMHSSKPARTVWMTVMMMTMMTVMMVLIGYSSCLLLVLYFLDNAPQKNSMIMFTFAFYFIFCSRTQTNSFLGVRKWGMVCLAYPVIIAYIAQVVPYIRYM